MATAIEYGLVAALIAVAATAGLQSVHPVDKKPDTSVVKYDPPVLVPLKGQNPDAYPLVVIDRYTRCEYIETGIGIIKREGIPCPVTRSH